MFLDLAATFSSLIFASFAFLRLLEPLGKTLLKMTIPLLSMFIY